METILVPSNAHRNAERALVYLDLLPVTCYLTCSLFSVTLPVTFSVTFTCYLLPLHVTSYLSPLHVTAYCYLYLLPVTFNMITLPALPAFESLVDPSDKNETEEEEEYEDEEDDEVEREGETLRSLCLKLIKLDKKYTWIN